MREDGERDKGIKTEVLEDGEMPEDEGELWCSLARKESILTNPFNPDAGQKKLTKESVHISEVSVSEAKSVCKILQKA